MLPLWNGPWFVKGAARAAMTLGRLAGFFVSSLDTDGCTARLYRRAGQAAVGLSCGADGAHMDEDKLPQWLNSLLAPRNER